MPIDETYEKAGMVPIPAAAMDTIKRMILRHQKTIEEPTIPEPPKRQKVIIEEIGNTL